MNSIKILRHPRWNHFQVQEEVFSYGALPKSLNEGVINHKKRGQEKPLKLETYHNVVTTYKILTKVLSCSV